MNVWLTREERYPVYRVTDSDDPDAYEPVEIEMTAEGLADLERVEAEFQAWQDQLGRMWPDSDSNPRPRGWTES